MTASAVRSLDQIIDRIKLSSGADFAFVLTKKGRLVTHDAPRDMPEVGRARLVRAARSLKEPFEVVEVTLPRLELVPYGGAAPVDVYVSVGADSAIVCVVMATWTDKTSVVPALQEGLPAIEAMLRHKRHRPSAPPPAITVRSSERPPPAVPGLPNVRLPAPASVGLVSLAGAVATASPSLARGPEISLGLAPLGRESMAAIEAEQKPDITIGVAPLGRESLAAIEADLKLPELSIGVAPLGRESMAAIAEELSPGPPVRGPFGSMPDGMRVKLESDEDIPKRITPDPARMTLPWVEAPEDARRSTEAARYGRQIAPPALTLKLDELDEDTVEAALMDEVDRKRGA